MGLQVRSAMRHLPCHVVLLALFLFGSDAVVRRSHLPGGIKSCYNNYASTNFKDVVAQQFCYFCEERVIQGELAKIRPKKEHPTSNKYVSDLLYHVDNISQNNGGRVKRQTRFRRCIRREYRRMSDQQRRRFHRAINVLKRDTTVWPNKYDAIAALHTGMVAQSAHGGANFLGWHRVFILILEIALQQVDPSVCVPYWDSTLDNELPDPTMSNVFGPEFLGGRGREGAVIDGPFANWRTPWHGPLIRNIGGGGSLLSFRTIQDIMTRRRTSEITPPNAQLQFDLEFHHGGVHNYVGGQMLPLQSAAMDPAFFLHHCFVDYLWEMFRNRQRAQGMDPQFDYPENPGSELHFANANLGFNLNLTTSHAYWNEIAESYEYEPSPTCNRFRRTCGSRYLECHEQRQRCVPVEPVRRRPGFRWPRSIRKRATNSVPRSITSESYPQPCKNRIIATQNTFCIDGNCDMRQWVYVPVKVVSIRSPSLKKYDSYPIIDGKITTSYDIYKPSAYKETGRFSSPISGYPRGYDKCDGGNGMGQIFVQSQGLNYEGFYKESALVDQRLVTAMSVAFIAVKNPKQGRVRALFRAFDSCGRLCRPACRIPGTEHFRNCEGAVEILDIPGQPKQYSFNYGEASMNTWSFDPNDDCPSLKEDNIPLTFYCDYKNRIPWTSPAGKRGNRVQSSQRRTSRPARAECRIDAECTIDTRCDGPCDYGQIYRCRGSCNTYALCQYGQFHKRKCPHGTSIDTKRMRCSSTLQCFAGRTPARTPVGKEKGRTNRISPYQDYLVTLLGDQKDLVSDALYLLDNPSPKTGIK